MKVQRFTLQTYRGADGDYEGWHLAEDDDGDYARYDDVRAAVEQRPVAFVPVHPVTGPLWADAYSADAGHESRALSYERMPLYAAAPIAWDGAKRMRLFLIGRAVEQEELDDAHAKRLGLELQRMSRICPACRGTGRDGDPPDTNGEGGWTGDCAHCGGSGDMA